MKTNTLMILLAIGLIELGLATSAWALPQLLDDLALRSYGIAQLWPSQCTVTRIDENILVTSAHCVSDPQFSSSTFEMISDHFHSEVRILSIGTDHYNEFISRDWALLESVRPLPTDLTIQNLLSLDDAEDFGSLDVSLTGFWQPIKERYGKGGIDSDCKLIRRYKQVYDDDYVFIHNCEGSWGGSGAPLFVTINGERKIAAFHARYGLPSRATWCPDTRIQKNMAVPASHILNFLLSHSLNTENVQ